MTKWLRARTIFQYIALGLLLLALCALVFSAGRGGGFGQLLVLALIVCFFAFRKELLWRVRTRLLITYLLFGVVPIFLIWISLMLTGELVMGQFAAQRVRQGLIAETAAVHSVAENLVVLASHGEQTNLLDQVRQRTPNLNAVVQRHGQILPLPANGAIASPPLWLAPQFSGVFTFNGRHYVGSHVRDGDAECFAYVPLDEQLLAGLAPGAVSVASAPGGSANNDFAFGPSGSTIKITQKDVGRPVQLTEPAPARAWWDVPIAGMLAWKVQTESGEEDLLLPLASRPSLLLSGTLTGPMTSVVVSILWVVGTFFLLVEFTSLISSVTLTRAITRSVDDLYRGTLRVASGDFTHAIPVRGKHQLSELATSFNSMSGRIHTLIGEVKRKEKLDAELEIARQVQLRLFPKSLPQLSTLQMAGVCLPGRVVSGDYYDAVPLPNHRTAIALGDISGKGVSAALLMASIQSALHAQLKFNGASDAALSTATLTALIGQQLYENTPPEKYATFFLSIYDDTTGRLTYTNGGHLKPILVRDGQATTLEGDGMVVGLLPGVKYEEQDVLLQAGDLLAIFSDGIPEAEDAQEQEFGEDRLAELLVAHAAQPLDEIVKVVTATVEKWTHDPEGRDDLTLLLLRKL